MSPIEGGVSHHERDIRQPAMQRLDKAVEIGLLTFGDQINDTLQSLDYYLKGLGDPPKRERYAGLHVNDGVLISGLEAIGLFNRHKAYDSLQSVYKGMAYLEHDSLGLEMDCEPRGAEPIDASEARRRIVITASYNLDDPTRVTETDEGYLTNPIVDWASYHIEVPTQSVNGVLPPAKGWFWGMKKETQAVRNMSFERQLDEEEIAGLEALVLRGIHEKIQFETEFAAGLREKLQDPKIKAWYEHHQPTILDTYNLR